MFDHGMPSKIVWNGFYKVELIEIPGAPHPLEIIHATDSVSVLFYNLAERYALLVRQPRIAMATDKNPEGMITETVAGRFDLKIGARGLIVKEALEEAGVEITEGQIEMLNNGQPMALTAGCSTEKAYLAICEINATMIEAQERVFGVKDEGEEIERIFIPFADLEEYVCEDLRVFTLIQYLLSKLTTKAITRLIDDVV